MKPMSITFSVWTCFALLLNAGCSKKNASSADNETTTARDATDALYCFTSLSSAVMESILTSPGNGYKKSPICSSMSFIKGDTIAYSSPVIYGLNIPQNCRAWAENNAPQAGSVTARVNAPLNKANTTVVIKLNEERLTKATRNISLYCDSIVMMTLTTYDGKWKWNYSLVGGRMTEENDAIDISWSGIVEYTGNVNSDIPTVTLFGSGNGTSTARLPFSFTIPSNDPVKWKGSCDWFPEGIMDVQPQGFSLRTIDYGNGSCDRQATFFTHGNRIAFELK